MIYVATKPYDHPEAFCLMKYASHDGREVEWLWNSRDGVTPYGILNRAKTQELFHVDWHLDRRLPRYQPCAGERVFVDLTPHLARPMATEYATANWNREQFPLRHRYPDLATAIEALLQDWTRSPGAPMVILWEEFQRRQGGTDAETPV